MTVRLSIRGYAGRALIFQDRIDVEEDKIESVIPKLAEDHTDKMLLYPKFTIEIEFLDEPDFEKRFFRMGNSTDLMREPLAVDLTKKGSVEQGLKKWKGI